MPDATVGITNTVATFCIKSVRMYMCVHLWVYTGQSVKSRRLYRDQVDGRGLSVIFKTRKCSFFT